MAKNAGDKSFGLSGAKRASEATSKALRKLFGRQTSSASSTDTGNGAGAGAGAASGESKVKGAGVGSDNGKSEAESQSNVSHRDPNGKHDPDNNSNGNGNHSQRERPPSSGQLQNTAQSEPANISRHSQDIKTTAHNIVADNMANREPNEHARPAQLGRGPNMSAGSRITGKENQPLPKVDCEVAKLNQPINNTDVAPLATAIRRLSVGDAEREAALIVGSSIRRPDDLPSEGAAAADQEAKEEVEEELTEEEQAFRAERAKHLVFIEEALDMARLALKINETPVGCVLVHHEKVIARGMNATNVTRNGTRHAEFMALCALLSHPPEDGPRTTALKPNAPLRKYEDESDDNASTISPSPYEGNEDGKKSHLYPYGQKEHPDERIDRAILRECTLYVTVEPCVMCASLLRQLGIKKVFFGAVNDKFGGTGGVFSIHANSLPVRDDGQTASAHPQPPPMRLPDGKEVLGTSFPASGGDGGNVEPGYEIEGGWGRDDAVGLLRRFYVQENGRAPVPRKKEGRAARLAAMMEKDDNASINSGSASGGTQSEGEDTVNTTDKVGKIEAAGNLDG